jgi:hypothetical protein
MRRVLLFMMCALFSAGITLQAQTTDKLSKREAKKAAKAAQKQAELEENKAWYAAAVKALEDEEFVLEADRVEFKRGRFVYVTPSTNFVSLTKGQASIQLSFNTGAAGPNGIGGITVEGKPSGIEMSTDKKGNVNFKMMVQGSAVSASVTIRLQNETNKATVTVNPNFNSNRISFTGTLYPTEQSNIFKGRSLF